MNDVERKHLIEQVMTQWPQGMTRWKLVRIFWMTGLGMGMWPIGRALVASVLELVNGREPLLNTVIDGAMDDGHRQQFSTLLLDLSRAHEEDEPTWSYLAQLRIANKRRRIFVEACLWAPSGVGLPLAVHLLNHWDRKCHHMAGVLGLPVEADIFGADSAEDVERDS